MSVAIVVPFPEPEGKPELGVGVGVALREAVVVMMNVVGVVLIPVEWVAVEELAREIVVVVGEIMTPGKEVDDDDGRGVSVIVVNGDTVRLDEDAEEEAELEPEPLMVGM